MAVFGLHLLTQPTLYWDCDAIDPVEPVDPILIMCRWEYGYITESNILGQTIQYTGRVFCSQRVVKGGLLLEGSLTAQERDLLDKGVLPSQLPRIVRIAQFKERVGIDSKDTVYEARF